MSCTPLCLISWATVALGCAPRLSHSAKRSGLNLDTRRLAAGIIGADLLQATAVTGISPVGDDDAVEGIFLAAVTGQTNNCGHDFFYSSPGGSDNLAHAGRHAFSGKARHVFHHLFGLLKLFEKAIDIGDVTPLPAAMRRRRLPLMIAAFSRSSRVIELMIASVRFSSVSAVRHVEPFGELLHARGSC